MPKGDPPIKLHPAIYEAWLSENPKIVEGGPLELIPVSDYDDENAVVFEAHHIDSEILPKHYADTTMIHSQYCEFEGLKIWVTPKDYDYLLMAHQKHHGPFRSVDRKIFENHPHFHELDYYAPMKKGKPETRRIVPESLQAGINSAELLEAFLCHYYIDDNRPIAIQLPNRNKIRQRGLDEF